MTLLNSLFLIFQVNRCWARCRISQINTVTFIIFKTFSNITLEVTVCHTRLKPMLGYTDDHSFFKKYLHNAVNCLQGSINRPCTNWARNILGSIFIFKFNCCRRQSQCSTYNLHARISWDVQEKAQSDRIVIITWTSWSAQISFGWNILSDNSASKSSSESFYRKI